MLHTTPIEASSPTHMFDDLEDLLDPSDAEELPQVQLHVQVVKAAKEEFSLDDLLNESMAQKKEADAIADIRKVLSKTQGMIAGTRAALERTVRAWEAKREWHMKATVAMFSRQFCDNCDYCHLHFLGFYQRQTHRHSKADRWVQMEKGAPVNPAFPKESKYKDSIAEMCEECAMEAGFPIELDEEISRPTA